MHIDIKEARAKLLQLEQACTTLKTQWDATSGAAQVIRELIATASVPEEPPKEE